MKYVDILKKAEVVGNDFIIIDKPTKKEYGTVVKLTSKPYIKITQVDTDMHSGWKTKKIKGKKYWVDDDGILINIEAVDNLINAIQTLLNKELWKGCVNFLVV